MMLRTGVLVGLIGCTHTYKFDELRTQHGRVVQVEEKGGATVDATVDVKPDGIRLLTNGRMIDNATVVRATRTTPGGLEAFGWGVLIGGGLGAVAGAVGGAGGGSDCLLACTPAEGAGLGAVAGALLGGVIGAIGGAVSGTTHEYEP